MLIFGAVVAVYAIQAVTKLFICTFDVHQYSALPRSPSCEMGRE